jgi:hypothetical protein
MDDDDFPIEENEEDLAALREIERERAQTIFFYFSNKNRKIFSTL